jgi:opacity protein-like surface antigen
VKIEAKMESRKMKSAIGLIIFGLTQLFIQNAYAEAKNFEGFSAAAGVNFVNNTSTFYGGANNDTILKGDSTVSTLDFSYNKAVSDQFLIGAGLTYDIGNASVNNWTVVDSGVTYTATSKITNHYSVYVKPTFAVTERVALFAKLGYNFARMNFTDTNGQMYSWSSGYVNLNKNVNAVGYGLGLTVMITDSIFASGEYSYVDFGKVTLGSPGNAPGVTATSQPRLNQGILSVGYRF